MLYDKIKEIIGDLQITVSIVLFVLLMISTGLILFYRESNLVLYFSAFVLIALTVNAVVLIVKVISYFKKSKK